MPTPPPQDPAAPSPPSRAARASRPARGWEPYLVPYAAFLGVVQVGAWLPAAWSPWVLLVQVALPGGLFLLYAGRGRYPELAGWRPGAGGVASDVGVGLGVAALWVAPYLAGWLPAPEAGFDPDAWGADGRAARLALRAAGFALVTPFVEELFVRSFLIRWVELVAWRGGRLEIDDRRDFRDLPVARYTAWSFWITVVYFALSHALWEMPVAFAAGALYNLWLYRRGHLGDLVLSHAVTNAAILAGVVLMDAHWYLL